VIERDKCAFWSSFLIKLQNFDLICYFGVILHSGNQLASLFEELYHFSLVEVVLNHHDLVVLLLQLNFILEFVFNLLIYLFLKVLSQSLAQFASIIMLN
jgi:hypothetical protein